MRRTGLLSFLVALSAAIANGSNALASTAFMAFYVPWDSGSQSDLTQHMRAIDVFVPQWFTLIDRQGTVTTALDPATRALLSQTHHPVAVMPLVSNAHDGTWDSAAAEAVIDDPVAQIAFVHQLAALAQGQHYQGYVLDFENLPAAFTAKIPQLLNAIHAALPSPFELSVTVPLGSPDWPLRSIQASNTAVVFMAYDQCWANSTPGPIAGLDWFTTTLKARLTSLDPSHVTVVLASYAYDWPNGKRATVLSVDQARELARINNVSPTSAPPVFNSAFAYQASDGTPHTVWMLDARTFAMERSITSRFGVKHIGLWRLGLEDAGLWVGIEDGALKTELSQHAVEPVCEPL